MGVGGWGWTSLESAGFWPGAAAAATYISKVLGYSPIAYWPLNEASGSTAVEQVNSPAQDGAYTGVTLGQTGIGDGETCPLFDGANDYNNIYTATFSGVFDGAEGSVLAWFKVSGSGAWTDGSNRGVMQIRVDVENLVRLAKDNDNNTFVATYEAGNVLKRVTKSSVTTTDWVCGVLTWSATADALKFYWAGAQEGSPQTSLGTWAGGSLDSVRCCIGATRTTPVWPWDGWVAHVAVWDSVLGAADVADLAVV